MKIGIIADIHLKNLPAGEQNDEAREKVFAFYKNAKEQNFDFVINLGDLMSGTGNEEEDFDAAYRFSRQMISETMNTYYVLGNHDTMTIPRDLFLHCSEKLGGAYTFTKDNVLFVALDANYSSDGLPYKVGEGDWTDAYVPSNQIEFLKKTLAESPCKIAVIMCHQRLDMFMNEFEMLNPHVVSNSEEIREILENSGKKTLVLQAHYHSGDDVMQRGIRYYTQTAFFNDNVYSVLTVDGNGFEIENGKI